MWKICTLATSLTVFWLNLQLGLCDQFYDDEGDEMLSPCLGLYYLLPGLCRIMGEMYAVSLSGSLLPAFRPCWMIGGDVCRLLVWASTTCSQASAGWWGRCLPSPYLGLYYQLSDLAGWMGEMSAVSLSGSLLPAFRPCWILGEMSAVFLSNF